MQFEADVTFRSACTCAYEGCFKLIISYSFINKVFSHDGVSIQVLLDYSITSRRCIDDQRRKRSRGRTKMRNKDEREGRDRG